MTRNQLVRILCITLVTVTLALALILAVAVIGGELLPPAVSPDVNPDFTPSIPQGSFDFGDLLESLDPGDFTRDPDSTRPSEPEMTLPDWESGWEWPTLPPTLETSPDIELPTLPEEWDTLPPEWETLPSDWGDAGDGLPFDPEDLADLLAGMDGGLGMPPGALAAGVASQLTVMEVYAEQSDRLYLKMQSFGDYTGQEWTPAESYNRLIGGGSFSAVYLPHFAMNQIHQVKGEPLVFTPVMDVRVIPYYLTSADTSSIQEGDVLATGDTDHPYTLYYRPYAAHHLSGAGSTITQYELDYRRAMEDRYLAVDETTLEYLRLIIKQQGFDKDDPDIVQKVATYIQNAAAYNLAYDRNLDKEPNVALAFLGAYKEGVCRHFATAATLLYRALGIPARYTVGFMTDVTGGVTTPVKGMDAHAWVEVYEEGFGWRYVEVTGFPAGDDPTYPPEPGTGTDTTPGTGDGTEPPVEPDQDPTTWGDLLAATNGQFTLSPSIPPAMLNSQVFSLTNDTDARLLLKLKSFGDYTGQGFATAPDCSVLIYTSASPAYMPGAYLELTGAAIPHTLTVRSPLKTVAAPYYPRLFDTTTTVEVGDTRVKGNGSTAYTIQYFLYTGNYNPKESPAGAYEAELISFVYENYLTLDENTRAYLEETFLPALEAAVGDLSIPHKTIDKVSAYLRDQYTLTDAYDPALDTEANVATSFLEAYREGNPRHFAAAATLIYRALGIPARYTVGYLAETNADTETVVSGRDAYAWVEVYVEGFGWMTVDVVQRTQEGDTPADKPVESNLTLKPVDMTVPYTGEYIYHSGELEGFETLAAKGYTYKAEVQGQRFECGVSKAILSSVTIYDPKGNDVTHLFRITKKSGTIFVYLAELTFGSTSHSKTYDGTPLTTADALFLSGTLPQGYMIEILRTGSRTTVGTGYAAFDIKIWYHGGAGAREDHTHYFLINKVYGTLTVTPAPLTIKAADAEKVYDGEALTAHAYELIGALASGDTVESVTVEGSQTRIGRSENLITDVVIRNEAGEDVTRNYAIETVAGILTVTAP